jgi:hypothetical protein
MKKIFKVLLITLALHIKQEGYANDSLKLIQLDTTVQNLKQHLNHTLETNDSLEKLVLNVKLATFAVDGLVLLTALFGFIHFISTKNEKRELKSKLKEINDKQVEIEKYSEDIKIMTEDLKSHESYMRHGFDTVYELLIDTINNGDNDKLKELALRKKAVSDLFSSNSDERFRGIADLSQRGKPGDIQYLQKIVKSSKETDENKNLAINAIVKIRARYPDEAIS